jgi:hypothetical protein
MTLRSHTKTIVAPEPGVYLSSQVIPTSHARPTFDPPAVEEEPESEPTLTNNAVLIKQLNDSIRSYMCDHDIIKANRFATVANIRENITPTRERDAHQICEWAKLCQLECIECTVKSYKSLLQHDTRITRKISINSMMARTLPRLIEDITAMAANASSDTMRGVFDRRLRIFQEYVAHFSTVH